MSTKMTKREIIKKVTQIILKHARPERIYLYGSQASGDSTPTSDIDIAFHDENCKYTALTGIKEEVEKLPTLLKIDIVNLLHTEAAILILTNLGATTESCPYKYGKYLPIIGDFRGVGAGLRARPVKISFS